MIRRPDEYFAAAVAGLLAVTLGVWVLSSSIWWTL